MYFNVYNYSLDSSVLNGKVINSFPPYVLFKIVFWHKMVIAFFSMKLPRLLAQKNCDVLITQNNETIQKFKSDFFFRN